MRAFFLLAVVLLGSPAWAQQPGPTFTVTTTADTDDGFCDAHCSLREALTAANDNPDLNAVVFDPSLAGQTITLGGAELVIASAVTVTAPEGGLTLDGDRRSQVLDIVGGPAELVGLTITGGREVFSSYGGGIYVWAPAVTTLRRCIVTGNETGAELDGGGIYAATELHIIESTISNNRTYDTSGGGLYLGGDATIERSTISGNSAGHGGGMAVSRYGVVTISNSTITRNGDWGTTSGGIALSGIGEGQVRIANSIIAGNDGDCGPSVIAGSDSYNVVGTGCPTDGPGDVAVDPGDVFTRVIAPALAANGGPAPTHALVYDATNPALDLGGVCGPTDQRGLPSPVDGPDADATPECDAGAVEAQGPDGVVATAEASEDVPEVFALHPARPNPSLGRSTLGYDLPDAVRVRIAVYDLLGRRVMVLVDRDEQAGRYEVAFEGAAWPAGVYLVRLEAGAYVETRRITLVR